MKFSTVSSLALALSSIHSANCKAGRNLRCNVEVESNDFYLLGASTATCELAGNSIFFRTSEFPLVFSEVALKGSKGNLYSCIVAPSKPLQDNAHYKFTAWSKEDGTPRFEIDPANKDGNMVINCCTATMRGSDIVHLTPWENAIQSRPSLGGTNDFSSHISSEGDTHDEL